MYTYDLLEVGCYYLVKELEDDPTMTEWKLKKDALHDIIECLNDETVKQWEEHYRSSEDAYYEEDDED